MCAHMHTQIKSSMHQGTREKFIAVTQVGTDRPLAVGAGTHLRPLPDQSLPARSTWRTTLLVFLIIAVLAEVRYNLIVDLIGISLMPKGILSTD